VANRLRASRLSGVELRHLTTLRTIASAGSFSAAAVELGYTQSAVSNQIRILEELVGLRLIERVRGRRSVRLTAAGNALCVHAVSIAAELAAAERELADV
jgi:molybdate transport repressor ModE-like protein